MDRPLFDSYLRDTSRQAPPPPGSWSGAAGGAPCGDLIRISLRLADGRVAAASFDAEGCATARATAAAAAELAEGREAIAAARIAPGDIAGAVGGLTAQGSHAAELAADALHRALGAAASSGERLAAAGPHVPRVLVALSGGVDSAVAALLERERGVEVVAVTLKLWADRATDGERSCCSPEAVIGARSLAHSMGIGHITLDLREAFAAAVVGPFIRGHVEGNTPNPCVICNGDLRLDAMVALAERAGAGALATGHYARIADDGNGPLLAAPADSAKDQTYMLSGVRPRTLAALRFPLAGLRKPAVRELASRAGLPVAARRESQDLCFLAGEGKRAFLARHGGIADRDGELVDAAGQTLGRHHGHHHFTVGQRRGIGLAARSPLYVIATDAGANRVTIGERDQLAVREVRAEGAMLHRPPERVDRVKLRYRSPPIRCSAERVAGGGPNRLRLALGEPAYGVAPGQTACLMAGDLVVGRATIVASSPS